MSFVKQQALFHNHVMNERTEFALSAQGKKEWADCTPPRRMISWFGPAVAEARW